jgi:type II secretory pathway pseudopilin PulG
VIAYQLLYTTSIAFAVLSSCDHLTQQATISFDAAAAAFAAASLTRQVSEQLEAQQQQHQQLQQLRQQLHIQSRHSAATNDSSMFYSPMQSEAGSVAAVEPLLSAGQSPTAAAAGGYRRCSSFPASKHRLSNSAVSKRLLSKLQRVTNDDGMGAVEFDEEGEQQQGQAAAAGEAAAAGTSPGPTEALTTTAGNLARWAPTLCCLHALCVVYMRSTLV